MFPKWNQRLPCYHLISHCIRFDRREMVHPPSTATIYRMMCRQNGDELWASGWAWYTSSGGREQEPVIAVESNWNEHFDQKYPYKCLMAIKESIRCELIRIEINDKIRCQPGDKHNGWSRFFGRSEYFVYMHTIRFRAPAPFRLICIAPGRSDLYSLVESIFVWPFLHTPNASAVNLKHWNRFKTTI